MRSIGLLVLLLSGCTPWERTCGGPTFNFNAMCRALTTSLDDPAPCPGQTITFSGQMGPPGTAVNLFMQPRGDGEPVGERLYLGTVFADENGTYRLTFTAPQVPGTLRFTIDVESAVSRMSRMVQLRTDCP